ncbi:MAG TPA: hypothetical protein GX743_06815 [Actinomycetales bacterium]|nr:hypothetical protein [Actinomycetales bacterium]
MSDDVPTSPDRLSTALPVPRTTLLVLGTMSGVLVATSGILYTVMEATGGSQSPLVPVYALVDVAREFNIATWFNSSLWLLLAVSTGIVAAHTRKWRFSWIVFTAIAAIAALDEFAMLHEDLWRLGAQVASLLGVESLPYSWVAAGLVLVVVVVAVLAPLMWALPRRILIGYVVAGGIFLLGAIVLETVGGLIEGHFGTVTWHLALAIHTEELLEMLGISLAIAVTLSNLRWERTPDGTLTAFAGYRA